MATETKGKHNVKKVGEALDAQVLITEVKAGNAKACRDLVAAVRGKNKVRKTDEGNIELAQEMVEAFEASLGETAPKGKRKHVQAAPHKDRAPGHNVQFVLKNLTKGITKMQIAEGLDISPAAAASLIGDCKQKGCLIEREDMVYKFTDANEVTLENYKNKKK